MTISTNRIARVATPQAKTEHLPLYRQIADKLRDEIRSGLFPVGSLLPTEDALCERFSVGRHTVREAIRRLRDENLVTSRQGAGTVVTGRASEPMFYSAQSLNDLVAYAADTHIAIGSMKMIEINEDLAQATQLPLHSSWLKVGATRIRGDEALPENYTDFYINAEYTAIGRLVHQNKGSIYTLIEDMFGVQVVEVRQEISACTLTSSQAKILGSRKGASALIIRREYLTEDERTVQVSISTHPASRFHHYSTMHLSR